MAREHINIPMAAIYEGEWKDDKKNGKGILKNKRGKSHLRWHRGKTMKE